ncbi:Hypothetical protein GLP15_145 [Giardia lamblia P15]|uniref:Uncharacterized protein n=1 Tax=Giardia intestinalis (strain P15) TaxID=658858 RepID=E1EY61_GIAIA|nr:Hypothetical protein GLP15_145 [Giardia lamblia P15]
MGDTNQPPNVSFPPEPLYLGSLMTYSGLGHLGPVLARTSHILHSNQRSITQEARVTAYVDSGNKASNTVYMPMRSFAPRTLTSKPLIEACPFKVSTAIYKELVYLETVNTACYPAHPFEAYNIECYYAASKFLTAKVSNYRHVFVSVQTGSSQLATHTFKFSGVVCSVHVDRHLLVVRTVYEIYGVVIFSDAEAHVLRRKLSHYGLKDVTRLFCQAASNIHFYPVIHYVRMDRSISRVAISRAWADIPAVSREVAFCVAHWDGTVRVFISSDDLLVAAQSVVDMEAASDSVFSYEHHSTVAMVAELTLPKIQPYSSSATPLGYIPVLAPEPLVLFSGIYPDRLYVAYGDMLFFSTVPMTVNLLASNPAHQSKKPVDNFIDCSKQIKPKPGFSSVRECFCEVGDRTSFTALYCCRNNYILVADADFLWVFSERNLIEPLIRLRHSLNKTAPIRAIHSTPLIPDDSAQESTLPLFRINKTDTTVETLSGANVTKSLELVLLLTAAQAASVVIGINNDVAGIVFSPPYLLMQAPVQSIRLWRTPMIMKVESDMLHLRALVPHGALLGSLDLCGYNYITGVFISSKSAGSKRKSAIACTAVTCHNSRTYNEEDVASLMATFASYYPLPQVSESAKASTEGIGMFIANGDKPLDCSIVKKNSDPNALEYARFDAEITLVFLSGERVVIDWSAQGSKELGSLLTYPISELIENQGDAPLLSYEKMISLLQAQRRDSLQVDPDDDEEINSRSPSLGITCVYIQNHAEKILSWINDMSRPYLQAHAYALLSRLTRLISSQRPCIPLRHLQKFSLGSNLIDNTSSPEKEPCFKRLIDSNEWSEGIIKSLFPAQLFDHLANILDLPNKLSEQTILPSSEVGMELIRQWREAEQPSIAHLFKARDNNIVSAPLLTDSPVSLPMIVPTPDADTLEEAKIHTQNIDYLVGLMKAVS